MAQNTILNYGGIKPQDPIDYLIIGGSLTENEYIKSFVVYYTQEVNELKRNIDWINNVTSYETAVTNNYNSVWKISSLHTSNNSDKNIMYYTGLNSVNKSYPFDSLPVIHLFHTIKDVSEVRLVITDYVGHPTIRVTTKYPIYLYDNSFIVKYRDMRTIHLDKEHTKLPDMLDSLKNQTN